MCCVSGVEDRQRCVVPRVLGKEERREGPKLHSVLSHATHIIIRHAMPDDPPFRSSSLKCTHATRELIRVEDPCTCWLSGCILPYWHQ